MVIGVPQFHRPAFAGGFPEVGPALLREAAIRGRLQDRPQSRLPDRLQEQLRERYDSVTVAMRHGLETVDILRLRRACGSVLQSAGGTAIAFLVPIGTVDSWHLPGSTCTGGAAVLPATDPLWLMPPAGPAARIRTTDAWVLRSALCEAARTLTAGGLGPF